MERVYLLAVVLPFPQRRLERGGRIERALAKNLLTVFISEVYRHILKYYRACRLLGSF